MTAEIEIMPFEQGDEEGVQAFFDSLADIDRTFIHVEETPGIITSWSEKAGTSHERRYLAAADGAVVGYLAVVPENLWSAHVAAVRIVVRPSHRRRGVATALAHHAVITAAREGIKKLTVEVLSDEHATVAMFTGLGFEAEGLLRDHLIGEGGEAHDLLVLSHFVDELYETMTTAGVEEAVTG
jgi:ribosomal protein S18 acetylase RimI-like enzyme